jgi:hypothetical protein
MKSAMFCVLGGLLLCLGGVGAIETGGPLAEGILFGVLGLGIMYCGTLMIKRAKNT